MEEEIEKIRSDRNLIMGAIITIGMLICIALVVLNSDVFFTSKKENCSKDPFASQENDIYNAKVKKYVGDEIKGSEVSLMLETIISMNQENAEQIGKFISVQVENIEGYSKSNKNSLEEECRKCNFYEDEMAENTVKNVRNATEEIRNLDRKINSSKKYKVEAKYEEGIIYKVIISENEKEDSNKKGKKDE